MGCRRSKSCGAVVVAATLMLCSIADPALAAALGHPQESVATAVTATVEEMPQRPMTLKNGYHPGLFPFNKGEPFVVDDPNMGSIDFNTKPPPPQQQRSDEYYDYDTKLEEVPYDYKGDPIDRKDVVVPDLPRPNDIVKPATGPKNKPTDIYSFLNLPTKYSASDYKFPLVSSSYANTKIQGSGGTGGGSSLSNHKMPASSTTAVPSTTSTTTTTTKPTGSWYSPVRTTTTTTRPTTTTTPWTTTTTTTQQPQPQEYEEESMYDYDYYHPQEPAMMSSTAAPTTRPAPIVVHRNPPTPSASTPEPTTTTTAAPTTTTTTTSSSTTTTPVNWTTEKESYNPVTNRTATTTRPEIDSKPDGTSFADYDTIKPVKEQQINNQHQQPHRPQEYYGSQSFKPLPGNYQFDEKTYPLIGNGKVPMTFTAHVSSGISLNQKEHIRPPQPPSAVSEPSSPPSVYSSSRPVHNQQQPAETQDSVGRPQLHQETYGDHARPTSGGLGRPADPSLEPSYPKPKPPVKHGSTADQYETVYYKVRPDTGHNGQYSPTPNRPTQPIQSRPPSSMQQPQEPPMVRKPVPQQNTGTELQTSSGQGRPSYPVQTGAEMQYTKLKQPLMQYTEVPPQSHQPDTSKFKPPKHVINHFIKTQPNEDNKSYALQTSFSIGMDGERTTAAAETRPAQGIGQVLMVEDVSAETVQQQVNQTVQMVPPSKPFKSPTTSVPLIVPPPSAGRPVQQKPLLQQSYPRPQWENIQQKPPAATYYSQPPPKRDGNIPPPQRTNLPNILPQFRPNAKVDTAPPAMMQQTPGHQPPHSATIERVQIPIDHLRPPPLPKPQFLKVQDRNDDNADEEMLDVSEKETRILHSRPQPQPAKVTTLQMIQHGAPVAQKTRDESGSNPVHVVYASANSPLPSKPAPSPTADDSVLLIDAKDRSDDVPVLKTKVPSNNRPTKSDFPYQIVKPDDGQNGSAAASLEYKAYSPTKPDPIRPHNEHQDLVPNLQDYVPVVTRDSYPSANSVVPQRSTITATLKTSSSEDNRKPMLQNFQIPFQPSMKLPENSNGWSVVRKSQSDNAAAVAATVERADETGGGAGDAAASTEKFDPDNFKPQLVGGFMPINPSSEETGGDKKTADQPERAK